MPTVVLTQPSGVGIPGTFLSDLSIPPSTTLIVDTCICQGNLSLKWIYTIMDSVDEDVLTAEVVANHRYGNDPKWNRYGLVGDRMLHSVDVQMNSGNMELRITNNHPTNTFRANIVRIEMLA